MTGAELHDQLMKQRVQEMENEKKRPSREVCVCVCVYSHAYMSTHSNAPHSTGYNVHIHYVGAAFLLCSEAEWDQVSNDDI